MNSLSFENRVSLIRKSEDLAKIIEDLSSDYQNRADFLHEKPCTHLFTSEVCSPFVLCAGAIFFIYAAIVAAVGAVLYAVAAGVGVVAGCVYEVSRGNCFEFASINQVSYKNVV
jgi:hypothetical protein